MTDGSENVKKAYEFASEQEKKYSDEAAEALKMAEQFPASRELFKEKAKWALVAQGNWHHSMELIQKVAGDIAKRH